MFFLLAERKIRWTEDLPSGSFVVSSNTSFVQVGKFRISNKQRALQISYFSIIEKNYICQKVSVNLFRAIG